MSRCRAKLLSVGLPSKLVNLWVYHGTLSGKLETSQKRGAKMYNGFNLLIVDVNGHTSFEMVAYEECLRDPGNRL